MGVIMKHAIEQKDLYGVITDPVTGKSYPGFFDQIAPSNTPLNIDTALIKVGALAVPETVANLPGAQVMAVTNKLDSIWNSNVSHPIANLVAEDIRAVFSLIRILGAAAGGSAEFGGILASGPQFDIWPARPKDIGNIFLNGAFTVVGAGVLGLYGGPSGGVFTWANAGMVAGVTSRIIPLQTTQGRSPFGGMVIFGGIEKTYTPKIESIQVTLQGATNIVPAQPSAMTMKRTFGDDNDISIFRFEKPILIPHQTAFAVDIMPNVSGFTNFELIACMVGQVQNKGL
jgi:hypothetical protein